MLKNSYGFHLFLCNQFKHFFRPKLFARFFYRVLVIELQGEYNNSSFFLFLINNLIIIFSFSGFQITL